MGTWSWRSIGGASMQELSRRGTSCPFPPSTGLLDKPGSYGEAHDPSARLKAYSHPSYSLGGVPNIPVGRMDRSTVHAGCLCQMNLRSNRPRVSVPRILSPFCCIN